VIVAINLFTWVARSTKGIPGDEIAGSSRDPNPSLFSVFVGFAIRQLRRESGDQ
jgi:hypothetical protein